MRVAVSKPSGSGFAVHWTLLLAEKLGIYTQEGLEVEIVQLDQGEGTRTLLSGEVPVMRRGPDETIALIDRGAEIRIVAGLMRRSPIYLYAADDVRSVADLRGRTIAGISAQFGSSLVLRMLLEDEGLERDAYSIVHTGGSFARFAAMQDGRAAAAVLSPPTNWDAEKAGFRLLVSFPERYPDFMFTAIQAQNRFAEAHPEVMAALMRAELRAQRILNDPLRKDECVALLAAADGIELAEAVAIYDTMVQNDRIYTTAAEIEGPALDNLLQTMIRFGEVRATMRPADCFERRYLDEARLQLNARTETPK
jgi:ABC-type nitrate/sulfonate/bicarbonate transport system substrate-binding protein